MPQLSKTSYIKGLQCQKPLYLYVNAPEKKDPLTQEEKVKFAFNVERQATNRKNYAKVLTKRIRPMELQNDGDDE